MRISDWSSDVCSSDLLVGERQPLCPQRGGQPPDAPAGGDTRRPAVGGDGEVAGHRVEADDRRVRCAQRHETVSGADRADLCRALDERGEFALVARIGRSEEHTSELQSLMRTSYAVFCLNKKKELRTN